MQTAHIFISFEEPENREFFIELSEMLVSTSHI